MTSASPAEHERAHGLAVFAAATFLLGMGLIAVLERVGAPNGFVQALGPLLALLGVCVIGVLTRAPNLLDFLAARRSAPTFYGGLAFAATAAGLVMAMASASGGVSSLPWRGVILGLAGAALLVAPALRGAKASAPADLLATAFPAALTRVVLALALAAAGLLTAIAGFELATDTLVGAIGSDRRFAEALVMLTLALSIVPGGFKGLVWSDAACGGGALLIAAVGAGVAILMMPSPFAPLATLVNSGLAEPVLGGPDSAIWEEIATATAIAGFFALTPPAIGARTIGQARRIGFAGLVFAGAGLALAGIALPYFGALPEGPSRTAVGLIGAATCLPALALARAGVLGATRAGGINLATAHSRLAVLSSRRIALNRLGNVRRDRPLSVGSGHAIPEFRTRAFSGARDRTGLRHALPVAGARGPPAQRRRRGRSRGRARRRRDALRFHRVGAPRARVVDRVADRRRRIVRHWRGVRFDLPQRGRQSPASGRRPLRRYSLGRNRLNLNPSDACARLRAIQDHPRR